MHYDMYARLWCSMTYIIWLWLLPQHGTIFRGARGKCVSDKAISESRDRYLELLDRSEIWQAAPQHCCGDACQISERFNNFKHQSGSFETLRVLEKRRIFLYWKRPHTVSPSEITTVLKVSWNLKVAGSIFRIVGSIWNLTGCSAALLRRCLSNFRTIQQF